MTNFIVDDEEMTSMFLVATVASRVDVELERSKRRHTGVDDASDSNDDDDDDDDDDDGPHATTRRRRT